MSAALDRESRWAAEWCRRFVERRCTRASPPLIDEHEVAASEDALRPAVLSLAEVDLGDDRGEARNHEYLAVLALTLSDERVVMRFVPTNATRSASRSVGSRRVLSDVPIRTPQGLRDVSFVICRVVPSRERQRALAAAEAAMALFDAAPDDHALVLARAVLERLEALDGEVPAVVVSGLRLPCGARASSRGIRDIAVVAMPPDAAPLGDLRFGDHTLLERSTGLRVQGRAYAMLRFGPRSTRQSVLELIDEIRRRHQLQSQSAAGSESFERYVGRQAIEAREKAIATMFSHLNLLPVVSPVVVEVASNLKVLASEEPPGTFLTRLDAMQSEVRATRGFEIPPVRVRLNEALPIGSYVVMLDEVPVASGNAVPSEIFCLNEGLMATNGDVAAPDGSGRTGRWLSREARDVELGPGIETWDAGAYIEAHLRATLIANLDLFATLDEIARLLNEADTSGALFDAVRKARGGLPRFSEVIRALLEEQISVIPVAPLAIRYLELPALPAVQLGEELRCLPTILPQLTQDLAGCQPYLLSAGFEAAIRAGVCREGDAAFLSLFPELTQKLLAAVRDTCNGVERARTVVIVEDHELRPFVRSLLEIEFAGIRVLASREIHRAGRVPAPIATIGKDL